MVEPIDVLTNQHEPASKQPGRICNGDMDDGVLTAFDTSASAALAAVADHQSAARIGTYARLTQGVAMPDVHVEPEATSFDVEVSALVTVRSVISTTGHQRAESVI